MRVVFVAAFLFCLISLRPISAQPTGAPLPPFGQSDDVNAALLDLFPPSTVKLRSQPPSDTRFNTNFTPTDSVWAKGLDETRVFHGELVHAQDKDRSYALRIGKGGQIYSLRGPFGESVPPSWRKEGANRSPWNDEVWQFVAVCSKYNGFDHAKRDGRVPLLVDLKLKTLGFADGFFVHNSGAYIPGDAEFDSLYCPLLSNQIDHANGSFRMLNWGLIPQIKTIHRSPILFYTQVRDAGNGVIELTWVVHNFSVRDDVVFDHLNAPWGGTRISSLPFRYVSDADGNVLQRKDLLNKMGVAEVRKTSGWNISCATEANDSPSLALVYGLDKHRESEWAKKNRGEPYTQVGKSLYRDWRASAPSYEKGWQDWQTRPENSFRNYDVCEVIPKLQIRPGTSIWYRSYLVVGPKDQVIEQSKQLVDHVDYGLLEIPPASAPKLRVNVGNQIVVSRPSKRGSALQRGAGRSFDVFAAPVSGTKPLFLIEHKQTKQQVVTTDPYIFVPQKKLRLPFPKKHPFADYYSDAIGYSLDQQKSNWKNLLGFGFEQRPSYGNWTQLSALLDKSTFPKATKFHLDLWVETTRQ